MNHPHKASNKFFCFLIKPQCAEGDDMATAGLGKLRAEEDAINGAGTDSGAGDDVVGHAGQDGASFNNQLRIGHPNR